MTVMLGAIINLILDPVFIYGLHMGVYGAAIATVISQGVSFMWVLSFFMGKKTFYHIKKENLILKAGMVGKITSLGISGFVMQGTNCLVQVVCNKMQYMYGGDMYVGIMTVINSVRFFLFPVVRLEVVHSLFLATIMVQSSMKESEKQLESRRQ